MKRHRAALFLLILWLAACGQGLGMPPIQDSRARDVTLPPPPTNTPIPTEIPTTEDAAGIALAFFKAWEQGDLLGMYSLLTPQTQALVDSASFVARYQEAMNTATAKAIRAQMLSATQEGNQAEMAVRVTWQTHVVGDIVRELTVPMAFQNGRWGIIWDEGLILPELAGGNRLVLADRVPARANIYDANGRALAYQGTAIRLGVIPGEIQDEPALLALLSQVLGKTPEAIKELYARALPNWYVPVGDVPEEVMQQYVAALQPFIGQGLAEPQPRLARLYAEDGVAPHLVGHTGPIPVEVVETYKAQGYRGDEIVGLSGLELWGEDYLNGERGGTLTVIDANGQYVGTVGEKAPKQARSLYMTLNVELQTAVEEILANAVQTYPLDTAGAAIVMDVNTGKILAMASYPDFDPTIYDPARPDAATALAQVFADPKRPLLNRAAQGQYPAGSLFKVVTFTAAMNSGLYTPRSVYASTGTWSRMGPNFIKVDWLPGGHGTVSYQTAITVSCNSCFYDAAMEMNNVDPNHFPAVAQQMGLGQLTGIAGIAESPGTIPSPAWKEQTLGEVWLPGDAVNMGIGQGYVQVTPLQVAMIFSAIANGGVLYRPTLIGGIGAGGGAPEESFPVQVNGEIPISPEDLASLQQGLFDVTHSGRGTAEFIFTGLSVPAAGKTGTAEDPPRNSHAWFAGYAPAGPYTRPDGTVTTEPEIAVVVILENAGQGSEVAAPIVRQIMETYFGITPLTPLPW
ncbi:MAG TPA: penicillin-binding transpeptidase domain-containing protein [Chloroflexota bacterium]|nr:penicillin-binding transpeptidase domain-containing protein [Chloroflexota bacterium]